MNKERLAKLANRLSRIEPEKFNMNLWCGSACCIAGHTYALFSEERPSERWSEVVEGAEKILKLDPTQSWPLMHPRIGRAWNATPKQAAKVIRNLIKTGKVEWEKFL